ncbi:hypothetical protein FRC10_008202 [Ceratobasidium sp. 414]|nr:hypothetical protein FRC10_008202 [Ceratobasidium sp. 414]
MDHLWNKHCLKHLYPHGLQSISANLHDMFLSTKHAGKPWLFWEKSAVVQDYFGIMTLERKACVEDALGPPKVSEGIFSGKHSTVTVWSVLHNLVGIWVGLKKFHMRYQVVWDYLLLDCVLFPQIQDKFDKFVVTDDLLGSLAPANLHDHATYGAKVFWSG